MLTEKKDLESIKYFAETGNVEIALIKSIVNSEDNSVVMTELWRSTAAKGDEVAIRAILPQRAADVVVMLWSENL